MAHAHLQRFPFSLAHPGHLLRSARTDADRLDQAQYLIEMTAVTLGVLVISWCHAHGKANDATARWENKLEGKGVSLGDWNTMLQAARPLLADDPDSLGRTLALAVEGALVRLKTFTETRNRYAHGGRPRSAGDRASAAQDLSHRADTLFDSMESLTTVRLAVVRASTRQGPGAYQSDLDVFTGPAEIGIPQRIVSGRQFSPGAVIAFSQGQLDTAADLTPFCLYRICSTCGRQELFYLSKRKNGRSDYYAFASGHDLRLGKDDAVQMPMPLSALGLEPLTARRTESAQGWRAQWGDLAPRYIRFAARAIDLTLVAAIGVVLLIGARLVGLSWPQAAVVALLASLAYEPAGALLGGTLGKRALRIQPISVWDSRPPSTPDALRRAAFIDLQILLPPLAIRTAAWILWDPARQGIADRAARSVVIQGRSPGSQKV